MTPSVEIFLSENKLEIFWEKILEEWVSTSEKIVIPRRKKYINKYKKSNEWKKEEYQEETNKWDLFSVFQHFFGCFLIIYIYI